MPMTLLVTTNVPSRFRGFLASCMCEIAPGVYTAPRMSQAVRERVWRVMGEWWSAALEGTASVVMTWPDRKLNGGQEVRTLGVPRQELWSYEGIHLAKRPLREPSLKTEST